MKNVQLKKELELLFGEETVQLALVQEVLARRYITKNPIKVRKVLDQFQKTKNIEQQKKLVADFDKELTRAFICSLLCGTASQAVLDLATRAIDDKRSGRAVLGGKILKK